MELDRLFYLMFFEANYQVQLALEPISRADFLVYYLDELRDTRTHYFRSAHVQPALARRLNLLIAWLDSALLQRQSDFGPSVFSKVFRALLWNDLLKKWQEDYLAAISRDPPSHK